jgi:phosphotransacetylase
MFSFLLFSCQKNNSEKIVFQEEEATVNERHCASNEVLQEQLLADPGLAVRMQKIESVTQQILRNPAA